MSPSPPHAATAVEVTAPGRLPLRAASAAPSAILGRSASRRQIPANGRLRFSRPPPRPDPPAAVGRAWRAAEAARRRRRRAAIEPPAAGEGADTDSAESGLRFKAVYVFDISQTDGEPLPQLATVTGDPGHYTERLKAVAAERGITVEYSADLGTAEGRSSGGRIELAPGLTLAHEFEVLAHELGHELLHHEGERRPRRTEELEAEAVAYAVCTAVGLDAKAAAADYIGLYRGDKDALAASLERVQAAVRQIVGGLLGEDGRAAEAA